MAKVLGYLSVLKTGGTPTALVNEPTTKVTANTVYQVTDPTKRCLDPDTAISVEVDPDGAGGAGYSAASAGSYTADYLTGTVTFLADQGAAALVRIASGKFIPLLTVADVDNVDADLSREELDTSVYGEDAPSAIAGRRNCTLDFTIKSDLTTDQDPGAGTLKLQDLVMNGTPLLLDWQPGGSGSHLRAWGLIPKGSVKAASNSLVNASCSFRVAEKTGLGRTDRAGVSWAP
jgi:hypothetical protein